MAVGAAAQVPVRCEDTAAALYLAPERWRGWAGHEEAMRENYSASMPLGKEMALKDGLGSAASLSSGPPFHVLTASAWIQSGPPVAKPEMVAQVGEGCPPLAKDGREAQSREPPEGTSAGPQMEGAAKCEQLKPPGVDQPGRGESKHLERGCPGEWLLRTVKVEAEEYSEWPAGLSAAEVLLSGLPAGGICKSEGLNVGQGYAGGLGPLSSLALHQWQMLNEEKPPGCPKCELPPAVAPFGTLPGDPRPRPFTCGQCGKAFGKKAHLTRHARIHTGERPFACSHCGRRFSQKIHLGSHERVHTGERPFPCDRCPKSFRKKTHLVRHQLTHTGERPHACPFCTLSFVHRRHLVQHQCLHQEGGAPCREGPEPGQGTMPWGPHAPPGPHPPPGQGDTGLCRGLSGHGQDLPSSMEQGEATAPCREQEGLGQGAAAYRVEAELGPLPPPYLGHSGPYQGTVLFKAQLEHELATGVPCLDCTGQREAVALSGPYPEPGGILCGAQAQPTESLIPCLDQVGKTEVEEGADAHQLPEEKPFLCSDCGKAFAWRKNLASHQRLHAEGGRPFSCAECGRGFSDKRHLTAHLRGHMGLLPYACPHCERSFAHRAGLAAHQCGGHTGQRPFACADCGRCFTHKRHLQRHRRNQHSAERPFSCAQCGRTFSTRTSLLAHLKSHAGQRPFACPLCGRAFSRKSHLARHEAVHTGLRPHACTQCPRRFSSKTNLVRHQAVHTGLRPYICTHCARSFSRKTHLLRHERTHTATPAVAPLPAAPSWAVAMPQRCLNQPPPPPLPEPLQQLQPPLVFPLAFEPTWHGH